MKFLPFENFYIITSLKPEEVQERLQKEIKPDIGFSFKNLFSSSSDYYFSGYAINGTFRFKRIINYRNSFLPQINGSTETWLNGSRVHVNMRMDVVVVVFMCIWLGGIMFIGIMIMLQDFLKGRFEFASLIPFAMFLFGYLLSTGGFKHESSKARNKLIELLNGEIA